MSQPINENLAVKFYVDEGKSVREIAEYFGTYANRVRRLFIKLGIPLKDKSEAQKEALLSGRSKHPTKGTKRSESTKKKISEGTYEYWQQLDDFTRKQQCHHLQDYWNGLSPEEKKEIQHLSSIGRRKAAKEGSKFELFLAEYLTKRGMNVILHKKGAIINPTLEIDLLIPALKTAIEVDGPTHFLPIHGEEKLKKQQRADNEKNGLLINSGWVIVRFKHIVNNLTEKYKNDSAEEIYNLLKRIESSFPPENKRLIVL